MQQRRQPSFIPPRAGLISAQTVEIEPRGQDERPMTAPRRATTSHEMQVVPPSRHQWLTPLVVGGVLVLLLYIVLTAYVVPFFTNVYNQWHYGDARIVQLDATINGRHDHFIAEVLQRKVLVIDFRNSDPSKAQVFVSPEPAISDHAQVTLETADVNGDGKTDMVMHVEGIAIDAILYSTGDTFQWTVPSR